MSEAGKAALERILRSADDMWWGGDIVPLARAYVSQLEARVASLEKLAEAARANACNCTCPDEPVPPYVHWTHALCRAVRALDAKEPTT